MDKPTIRMTASGNLKIHIPMQIKRMSGRKIVIAPNAIDGEVCDVPETAQMPLIQAIARAHVWAERLENGEEPSIITLANKLKVDASYVRRILKLTTLAPNIVEAILTGKEPDGLSLAKLVKNFPDDWESQQEHFRFH